MGFYITTFLIGGLGCGSGAITQLAKPIRPAADEAEDEKQDGSLSKTIDPAGDETPIGSIVA